MRFSERTAVATLRRHNYRVTPQRRAVVRTIIASPDHLTPAAIHARVQRGYPAIGLATVYRTLAMLASLNLICQLHTEDNCPSYTAGTPKHHHHVICARCGRVVNFTGYNIAPLEQRLSLETGFRIARHTLEFTGLCPACQQQPARTL